MNTAPALRALRAGNLAIGFDLRRALSAWRHKEIVPLPLNKSYEQKVLSPRAEGDF